MKKILILLLILIGNKAQAIVYFVSPAGLDTHTGLSWAQSFKTVQKAISLANAGDEIWVAAGTYYPDEGNGLNNDRNQSFNIKNEVALYGGFNGTETTALQRNWKTNPTILSAEVQQDDNKDNNAFHVIRTDAATSATVIDGFTITGGNANGAGSPGFVNQLGGGWFNNGSSTGNVSNPTISNCIFLNNYADIAGGAVFNSGYGGGIASPSILNCSFIGNSAPGKWMEGVPSIMMGRRMVQLIPLFQIAFLVETVPLIMEGLFIQFLQEPPIPLLLIAPLLPMLVFQGQPFAILVRVFQ